MLFVCALARPLHADDVKKWTDADGRVHYSVTGSATSRPGDAAPVIRGREATDDEKFSTRASLRRREIERTLKARAADLDRIRAEEDKIRGKRFSAWVGTSSASPEAVRASIDAQRDTMLAQSQFEQDKVESLRRLRRQEHAALVDLQRNWKDFAALGAEVQTRYGERPIWFRDRLDCGTCPSLAEVEAALHPKKAEPTPAPDASGTPVPEDDGWEEDEDWQ